MGMSIKKKITALALSGVLVLSGAVGIVGAVSIAPSDTGIVKEAQAKVKTKKMSVFRGWAGKWTIYGLSKKQKKKVKFKSSKKSVVKVTKKGKITALKAGKATLTAKYKGKLVGKYKFTVKDATKFRGTWKLVKSLDSDFQAGIEAGTMTGSMSFANNGTGKLVLSGSPLASNVSKSFKWYPNKSADYVVATIINGSLYINSSNQLVVSYGGYYFYFQK